METNNVTPPPPQLNKVSSPNFNAYDDTVGENDPKTIYFRIFRILSETIFFRWELVSHLYDECFSLSARK